MNLIYLTVIRNQEVSRGGDPEARTQRVEIVYLLSHSRETSIRARTCVLAFASPLVVGLTDSDDHLKFDFLQYYRNDFVDTSVYLNGLLFCLWIYTQPSTAGWLPTVSILIAVRFRTDFTGVWRF